MDFIVFVKNFDGAFWGFMFLGILIAYCLAFLKVLITDIKDVKLSYGPYCSNLKPLYKPYKKCMKEAFIQEWKTAILFVVLYTSFFYYQFG